MNREETKLYLDQKRDEIFRELGEFLAFRSISMDPAFDRECRACAEWLSTRLERVGFQCRLAGDYAKPVLIAERMVSAEAPTALYYGHYDVQPAGDEKSWGSPPFELDFRDGRMFARGAVDNKGQTFYFLKSVEWLLANDALNMNLRLVLEGEEETGSAVLEKLLRELDPSELRADALIVCDTGMLPTGEACLMIGLRGIAGMMVEIEGPSHELHSGYHGSLAPNPARCLSQLLASLFTAEGSIAVEGFYDGMIQTPVDLKTLIDAAPFDPVLYEKLTGVPAEGESGYSVAEKVGLRPSIDIHSLSSGYAGPGVKTVIPPSARASLTMRLAVGQDPERCLSLVESHMRTRLPRGLRLNVLDRHAGGPALLVDHRSEPLRIASDCLAHASGRQVIYRCHGASIPIIPSLAAFSGAIPIIAGFSHESDNLHGIDESFSWERFQMGFGYCIGLLRSLPEALGSASGKL